MQKARKPFDVTCKLCEPSHIDCSVFHNFCAPVLRGALRPGCELGLSVQWKEKWKCFCRNVWDLAAPRASTCYILHLASVILSLWNERNSYLVGSWIYCASISMRLIGVPMPCSCAMIHTTLDNGDDHWEYPGPALVSCIRGIGWGRDLGRVTNQEEK